METVSGDDLSATSHVVHAAGEDRDEPVGDEKRETFDPEGRPPDGDEDDRPNELQDDAPDLRFFGEFLPLTTLHALLQWEPKHEYVSRALYVPSERLDRRQRVAGGSDDSDVTKILCCHDMMGGYLDDRHVMGVRRNADGYTFRHWQCIDGFVYFSHHFVTVPPPCWVNAGHRHGCPVYGTIITEWENGRDLLESMLSSRAKLERSVQQLVNIALYYRMDGWLINIENEVEPKLVESLLEFLQLLRSCGTMP
jgi:mannosyl-glycoprotein endo-beta-N-acetylglucosaminidase